MCSTNGVFLGHGSKGIKGSDAVTKKQLDPEVRCCLLGEQSQPLRHLPRTIRKPVKEDMALPPSLHATKCLCDLERRPNSQLCPHIREDTVGGSLRAGCHSIGALGSAEPR